MRMRGREVLRGLLSATSGFGEVTVAPQGDLVLEVDGLAGGFEHHGTLNSVLKGISFSLPRGRMSAIVGETGSGKSLTALAIMGLSPRGFIRTGGSISYEGRDLSDLPEPEYRAMRGSAFSMVFQDARAALNPVFTIGYQLAATCRLHTGVDRRSARRRAEGMLTEVRIPDAGDRMSQYPHHFSGGMAQRVALALALICEPKLLLLDEPTTGLDVTIQADIMDLIAELSAARSLTTCLITHDLGLVAQYCDHVVVMRDGKVCEESAAQPLFESPAHPYTRRLLRASALTETSEETDE
jgi:ABC-type glutathione transport system ATPase component